MKKAPLVFAVVGLLLASTAARPQDCIFKIKNDDSLQKALKQFHDVMSSLVHGPLEKGDLGPVRAQAPEFAKHRDVIMAASLPPKLARRCPEISARAAELSRAVDRLIDEASSKAGDEAIKAAFDAVHAAYRNLNSAQTTLDDLLEAFHEILHPLWHDAYPAKDAAAVKAEIPKLKVRAKVIMSTAEASDKARVPGAKSLLETVAMLEEAAAARDDTALLEALRIVHDAYEKLAEAR